MEVLPIVIIKKINSFGCCNGYRYVNKYLNNIMCKKCDKLLPIIYDIIDNDFIWKMPSINVNKSHIQVDKYEYTMEIYKNKIEILIEKFEFNMSGYGNNYYDNITSKTYYVNIKNIIYHIIHIKKNISLKSIIKDFSTKSICSKKLLCFIK